MVTGLYFFSFIFITGASLGFSFTGWILGVSTVFLARTVIVKRVVRVSEKVSFLRYVVVTPI